MANEMDRFAWSFRRKTKDLNQRYQQAFKLNRTHCEYFEKKDGWSRCNYPQSMNILLRENCNFKHCPKMW